MTWVNLLIIAITAAMTATGNLLLKSSVSSGVPIGLNLSSLLYLITNLKLMAGMSLYLLAIPMWLLVLSKEQISKAQPIFTFLLLFFVAVGSYYWLSESMPTKKVVGFAIVAVGLIFIGKS